MKKLILLFAISACSNDALTLAKSMDPTAVCTEINTAWIGNSDDIASCRVGSEVWLCTVSHSRSASVPECHKIRDIPMERK